MWALILLNFNFLFEVNNVGNMRREYQFLRMHVLCTLFIFICHINYFLHKLFSLFTNCSQPLRIWGRWPPSILLIGGRFLKLWLIQKSDFEKTEGKNGSENWKLRTWSGFGRKIWIRSMWGKKCKIRVWSNQGLKKKKIATKYFQWLNQIRFWKNNKCISPL